MPGIAIGSTTNNRYQVLHCIAHSASTSSVWLVRDLQCVSDIVTTIFFHILKTPFLLPRNSTYKCLKARRSNDILPPPCGCPSESVFLRPPHEAMGGPHPGQAHINALVDSFTLAEDAEGDKLECMVSSLFGPSVKTLCHPHRVSLPWNVMKQVTVQLLMALWYLHSVKGVVHAGKDLLPHYHNQFDHSIPPSLSDIHMRNILLHPPKDHKDYTSTIEKFLNTLDPKEDTMGPIPFPLPDVDNVHVALVDFDLGKVLSIHCRSQTYSEA
ncbi:hypothetical protein PHLCEN_2v11052 [Hermanssonia centrifuga]|uniref:Protein kinase domain-containing protein n=1 Tax=Hermanssonia centrifuga TaxID=98765 RepID=A0A2R6NM37_9APHY|nr:hypothetical protein PHLCEN_2v11052 [Hermanssonia centrifuga]